MPRIRIPAAAPASRHLKPANGERPQLFNAHRQIKTSKGLPLPVLAQQAKDIRSKAWRDKVSPDVVDFLDRAEMLPKEKRLLPEEKLALLRDPVRFFSRPENVPLELRKQIYFPNFSITFMRTPHLPPKYAAFDVPLWFNKLDMKSYLKGVYNVDSLHIRSSVVHQKVLRRPAKNPTAQGTLYRPRSKKKMTVELVEPFVWPEEVTDFSDWEKDNYWKASKAQFQQQREQSDWAKTNPNEGHRRSIAEQARELLEGKTKWRPTWESIPADASLLQDQRPPRTHPPA